MSREIKRTKGGQFAKGTPSPNPNGRPPKPKLFLQGGPLHSELLKFASQKITINESGKRKRVSRYEAALLKAFSEYYLGKTPDVGFLNLLLTVDAAAHAEKSKLLQEAVEYKLEWGEYKHLHGGADYKGPPIVPDPDHIAFVNGEVILDGPGFYDELRGPSSRPMEQGEIFALNVLRHAELAKALFLAQLREGGDDAEFLGEELKSAERSIELARMALGFEPVSEEILQRVRNRKLKKKS